jgi:hypothetical protein
MARRSTRTLLETALLEQKPPPRRPDTARPAPPKTPRGAVLVVSARRRHLPSWVWRMVTGAALVIAMALVLVIVVRAVMLTL